MLGLVPRLVSVADVVLDNEVGRDFGQRPAFGRVERCSLPLGSFDFASAFFPRGPTQLRVLPLAYESATPGFDVCRSRREGTALPHILLTGEQGMGKRSIARVIAKELALKRKCAVKRRWSTAGGSPARELVRSAR
jgi:hypothetical protein